MSDQSAPRRAAYDAIHEALKASGHAHRVHAVFEAVVPFLAVPSSPVGEAPARLDDEAVHDFVWRLQRADVPLDAFGKAFDLRAELESWVQGLLVRGAIRPPREGDGDARGAVARAMPKTLFEAAEARWDRDRPGDRGEFYQRPADTQRSWMMGAYEEVRAAALAAVPSTPASLVQDGLGYGRNYREAMGHIRSLPPSERSAMSNRLGGVQDTPAGEARDALLSQAARVVEVTGVEVDKLLALARAASSLPVQEEARELPERPLEPHSASDATADDFADWLAYAEALEDVLGIGATIAAPAQDGEGRA